MFDALRVKTKNAEAVESRERFDASVDAQSFLATTSCVKISSRLVSSMRIGVYMNSFSSNKYDIITLNGGSLGSWIDEERS